MKYAIGLLLLCPGAILCQGAPGTSHDYRASVMASVQATDDMDYKSSEISWQLSRIEARREASLVIRSANSDAELKIAGAVWDFYENKITCRIELQDGSSLDRCRADSDKLRALILNGAGIDPRRVYPHAQ